MKICLQLDESRAEQNLSCFASQKREALAVLQQLLGYSTQTVICIKK